VPLPQEFVDLAREVNNWGRWGDDDELGTLNLIAPDVVKRAAACVRTGKTFALGLPLSEDGPQVGAIPGRINPVHRMTQVNTAFLEDPDAIRFSDDVVEMGLQCATHWDALSHASYKDTLYNGFPAASITDDGASRCSSDKIRSVVSRGVLLDVARTKGVDRLDGGYAITSDDLDKAAADVDVQAGDVVLIRTGHVQFLAEGDKKSYGRSAPGPGTDAVRWFHRHDVAAVATDTMSFEVFPCERDDLFFPVHLLDLVEMGMIQGQNFHLEALAADCADDGVYTFFLEATPDPFLKAVGAPVQPIAVK
jgi:kynurenine formamidase